MSLSIFSFFCLVCKVWERHVRFEPITWWVSDVSHIIGRINITAFFNLADMFRRCIRHLQCYIFWNRRWIKCYVMRNVTKFVTLRWKYLWRNDGENVAQTRQNVEHVCLHVVLFRSIYCYFNFWCIFSLCFLSYGDGGPSKLHLNLRGKHFLLLFCVICPCIWENCVPKIDPTRAIFSRLAHCLGAPLLRRFLLLSTYNHDWQIFQGWNWGIGIGIVTDWVLLFSSHTFRLKIAEINYIWSWRWASVRTRCVKFQSAD